MVVKSNPTHDLKEKEWVEHCQDPRQRLVEAVWDILKYGSVSDEEITERKRVHLEPVLKEIVV